MQAWRIASVYDIALEVSTAEENRREEFSLSLSSYVKENAYKS